MKAKYTWLADGTKLRSRDTSGRGFDYVGSLTYNSTGLEHAQFSHGVIRVNQEINYHITDHLGSVRAVIDGTGAVREKNDYYAFGAKHVRPDYPQTINRFNFNGKEAQDDLGLSFLDYGARMYDPELARWFNQDPLAEKYYPFSGYHFSQNNPTVFVDINGASSDWYSILNDRGETEYKYTLNYRSQKDLDRAGIKGKYLGLTYTDNNKGKYYSLLGDIFNFKTGNRDNDIQVEIIANLDRTLIDYYKGYIISGSEFINRTTSINISMSPLGFFEGSINVKKAVYQGGTVHHSLYEGTRTGSFDWGDGVLRRYGSYFEQPKPTVNAVVKTSNVKSNDDIIYWLFPNKTSWLKAKQRAEKLFKDRY